MDIDFKKYSIGDEKSILEVFEMCFNRKMTYNYWKWRYADNIYFKDNVINLAWDGNRLAGHYALSPTHIYINGVRYNSGLSMTTMTAPDYRGRGLFTQLARDLYKNNGQSIDIIYGVPNQNSVKGFIEKLDFKLISEIPMLECKVPEEKFSVDKRCLIIESFDDRFDELFEKKLKEYKVITSRNSDYLNWRFCKNPENKYQIHAYIEDNKILGYLVTKVYSGNGTRTGDIVDILVTSGIILNKLLCFAFTTFQSEKVSTINTWFNDKDLFITMEDSGFYNNGSKFNFIVRNNSNKCSNEIFDFNNWYITMSDIDIF